QTLAVPITLENRENFTMRGITLYASSSLPGTSITIARPHIDRLDPNNTENINATMTGNLSEGIYNITLTAEVKEPKFNQTVYATVSVKPRPGSYSKDATGQLLTLARDLLRQNPECLEFTEALNQARTEIERNNQDNAKRILDAAIKSCKEALLAPRQPTLQTAKAAITITEEQLPYAQAAAAIFAAIAVAIAGYYWRKEKHATHETQPRQTPLAKARRLPPPSKKWPA
ncbi:MAG: hypothetical protein AABW54_00300, partial [Candidatus Micrarchaeota archaeon]